MTKNRSLGPKVSAFSRRRRGNRPTVETLENRQLLSTVDWISPTSGSWNVAANWSTDAVPSPGSDVVINVSGATPTVTISSNVESVNSITADDPLAISGGGLTVAANSTISDGLAMTGGSLTASGSGVSLTVTGTTTVSGASLYAEGGAALTLPVLASYTGAIANTDTLQATGIGSLLSLPTLATITEDTTNGYSWTQIEALAGGSVNLPALPQISGGPVLLESNGTGSRLNVSALTGFRGQYGDGHGSTLQASGGGTILDGSLTSLNAINLAIDPTATLSTAQITSFTQGTFSLSSGTLSLPVLTDADGSSLLVSGGASLTLPALTSYTGFIANTDTLQATGTGSLLSLPTLATITEDTTNGYSWTQIKALAGGIVSFPALPQISGGPVLLESDGTGSQLDVSALTSFQGRTGDGRGSTLQTSDDGTILDASLTTLTQATLSLSSGTLNLPVLTNANGSSLLVSGGASLTLPVLASYTGAIANTDTLQATGIGSLLSLPTLATITEDTTNGYSWTQIEALAGGSVNLPALPQISGGPVLLESNGTGSRLNVSALTGFRGQYGDGHGSDASRASGGEDHSRRQPDQSEYAINLAIDPTATLSTARYGTSFTQGTLSLSSGTLSMPALTDADGSSFLVSGGASLTLPVLTSYTGILGNTDTLQATGTGSLLSLPTLATITEDTTNGYSWTQIKALAGGSVSLPALPQISGGPVLLESDGTGSQLDVPALTSFQGRAADGHGSTLQISNGGTIVDASLTTLTQATLSLSRGSLSLPDLTNANGSSLLVSDGASLTLPVLASYTGIIGNTDSLQATGAGSVLALPVLTTLTEDITNGYSWTQIEALAGAHVQLPALPAINSGRVLLESDGTGSVLNVSDLTSFQRHSGPGSASTLQASNYGTVLDGSLTSLNGTNLTLDGTSTIATAQITSYTGGTLSLSGGALSLPALTDADGSSLLVSGGSSLTLPALASYMGIIGNTDSLEATRAGSVLALPVLTTLTEDITNGNSWTKIEALAGGHVQLPAVTAINGGRVLLESDGTASTLDVSHLASFQRQNGPGSPSTLQISDGGTILDSSLATFTQSTLSVSNDSLTLPSLTDAVISSLDLGGGASLSLPVVATGSISIGSGQTVEIRGTLVSMPAPGTVGGTINVPATQGLTIVLQNDGALTGNVTLNVGEGTTVDLTGGTYTGGVVFNVAQGAVVDLTDGQTVTYSGTLSGSGSGTVQFAGGTMTVGIGGLALNFPGSMFQWTDGGLEASGGNVTNQGTINLSGSNETQISEDSALDDYGAIIQTGTGDFGLHSDNVLPSTLMIEPGGLYEIESNAGVNNLYNSNVIDNAGTIEKTAGAGTSTLAVNGPLINTGTIEVQSGTLLLQPTSFSQLSAETLTGGTWSALDGSTLAFPSGTSITTNEANVTLDVQGATIAALGGLTSNTGELKLTNGASLSTAGDFSNTGTLTIGIGSTLSVAGNEAETSDATLNVQIGGTPNSGQFGQMVARGTVTLAGTFSLALVNGFTGSVGQDFTVMSFAGASGAFSKVNLGPSFTEAINPTGLDLNSIVANPTDLSLSNVVAPTAVMAGQQITVTWQVTNLSANNATGNWQDSVYLSYTPTITSSSILLGATPHSGELNANGSYNGTLSAPVPALIPGSYYVLVQVDSLYQVSDPNRANNTLAATNPVHVGMPTVALGTPFNDSFTAADQDHYYQVSVPVGGSLSIALTSAAASGALALYVSEETPPTTYNFQVSADVANQPNQTVSVPNVLAFGTYYILVHSVSGSAATASFTITAAQSSVLAVSSASPASGGNNGDTTIEIDGSNFAATATASLTQGTTTLDATAIDYVNESQIYATFDLAGASIGGYTLDVQQATQSAASATGFQVISARTGNPIQLTLNTPALVRAGGDGVDYVTVTNVSDNDVPAPLLVLSSTGATLDLPSDPAFTSSSLTFLATSPTGPAGTLTAGESVTVPIDFQSTTTSPTINFQLSQTDTSQPFDWSQIAAGVNEYESNVPNAAAALSYLENEVGSTWADYIAMLDRNANLLPQQLGSPNDPKALFNIEFNKALAGCVSTSLSGSLQSSQPGVGLAGQSVYAVDSTSGATFATTTLNDGSFVFSTLPASTYTLSVDGLLLTSNATFTVKTGQSMTGVVLTATLGAQIAGQVVSQASNTPIAGATIQATNETGGQAYTVTADANGDYDLSGLPAGTYDLVVNATAYRPGRASGRGRDPRCNAASETFHAGRCRRRSAGT